MYESLKLLHLCFAALSITGFCVRAWWSITESSRLQSAPARIGPHIVDTLFLASGIALIMLASLPVIGNEWLLAKIVGLLAYIGSGTIAIKRGRTRLIRGGAAVVSLLSFSYIVGAAINKTPWSWLGPVI